MRVKILFLFSAVLLGALAYANASANPVREQSATAVGTGTTVSVSTSAWTLIPAASSLTGRQRLLVSNDKSNSTYMACTLSVAAPSEAITVHNIYISPGATIDIGSPIGISFYCIYTGTAAANIHVKEFNQ